MEGVLAICIPIIALIGAVIIILNMRKFQHIERMAMIDKGLDKNLFANTRTPGGNANTLRGALFLIGIGIGILLGYALDEAYYMEGVGYVAMLFIFGGLGLGIAYVIEERKLKKANQVSL
jgi:hypothetical protein